MSGLSPTGGAPTGGMSPPAGSGDLLIGSSSFAIFYNGASYQTGVFFSAGGSGASLAGQGHTANVFYDGFIEWMQWTENVPAVRGVYHDTSLFDAFTSTQATTVGQRIHAAETFSYSGSSTYVWAPGANIVEGFKVGDVPGSYSYAKVALTEGLQIVQKQVVALLATISEHMTVSPQLEVYLGSLILARMIMSDVPQATLKYHMTTAEALSIANIFNRFTGALLTEAFATGDAAALAYKAASAITEFLAVSLTQSYAMAFRVGVKDGVEISDDAVLRMIYRQAMTEIIDLDILYQSPNGMTTAWTVNTRTGAITEYQGWSFNSFAQMGNKYIAASRDGIYELNGPTDNGLSVVADIMGGFIQPGDGHLSGLKGVYLGQSGTGYWLLKLETGDGREYVYQRLSNPGMMTTKFTIGKGINARYIGWELINVEGQDFDLDTIEFVPMLRNRRV